MKRFHRPDVWFVLAVMLLTVVGMRLMNNRTFRSLDDRDWRWHAKMNAWQATFDALSATCGAGMLTTNINDEYTPAGRWLLTGLGVVGLLCYVAAAMSAVRRLHSSCGEEIKRPRRWTAVLLLTTLVALSVPVVGGLERLTAGSAGWTNAGGWNGSAWRAIAAAASLGWIPGLPPRSCTWIYAVVALLGGVCWTFWLVPSSGIQARRARTARFVAWAGGYVVLLALIAALIFALEAPRGSSQSSTDDAILTGKPAGVRFERSLIGSICAATAGLPTEYPAERNVTEGTKVALGGIMLLGPLLWTLIGGGAAFLAFRRPRSAAAVRSLLAGGACLLLLWLLATVVAFGLLLIETHTASQYQSPPTFADAFLDASSAVGGGDLSSGVLDEVTGRKLSRGIRQAADAYQYGMVWLMAAMLLGRVLPLFVLCQAAQAKPALPPAGTAPASRIPGTLA